MLCKESISKHPSFECLTVSSSGSKDSKGTTKLNLKAIRDHLSKSILVSHYGINASNHSNDVRKKSRDALGNLVKGSLDHGVTPKLQLICDLFHADDLAINHAHVDAFGCMERDYHKKLVEKIQKCIKENSHSRNERKSLKMAGESKKF